MASVLLVDDDFDCSDALARFLRKHGHVVRYAPDGQNALVSVLEHPPDVVVLDMRLPRMDGVGFLEIIRSYLRLSSLPVVMLTGYADDERIDRAHELGLMAILTKGKATPDGVLEWVNRIAPPRQKPN